jgi:HPt (histidine-containing phosphotransfer) domain-containing protein
MDDYVAKPIGFAQLRQTLAQWTDGTAHQSERLLQLASHPTGAVDFRLLDEIREVDRDLFVQLYKAFMREGGERLAELRHACEDHDALMAARVGLRLRDTCLAVGVTGMAEMCNELGRAAGLEDFDRCGLLLSQVEREFQRAAQQLEFQQNIRS